MNGEPPRLSAPFFLSEYGDVYPVIFWVGADGLLLLVDPLYLGSDSAEVKGRKKMR